MKAIRMGEHYSLDQLFQQCFIGVTYEINTLFKTVKICSHVLYKNQRNLTVMSKMNFHRKDFNYLALINNNHS